MATEQTSEGTRAALKALSPTILVVDDSPSNQLLMELYFKETGCTLQFALDGPEALEAYAASRPDLVIMDIQMPGMDGCEATRKLRRLEAESGSGPVPVLAVTASFGQTDRQRCLDAGCNDFLSKPVSKQQLLHSVAAQLVPSD